MISIDLHHTISFSIFYYRSWIVDLGIPNSALIFSDFDHVIIFRIVLYMHYVADF